jgi:hypothetical protein
MATANHTHAAPAASAAHDAGHHDAHAHAGHHGDHAAEVAGDKKAAFVGLVGGVALIGALVYGMVLWTNTRFAGHEGGEKAAAASTH